MGWSLEHPVTRSVHGETGWAPSRLAILRTPSRVTCSESCVWTGDTNRWMTRPPPPWVRITVLQKKGCLSKNISNSAGMYMTQPWETLRARVGREVGDMGGLIRRWDVSGCWNITGTQISGEEDSRGAAGATESTVSKGLCWDKRMPRREEGLWGEGYAEDKRPLTVKASFQESLKSRLLESILYWYLSSSVAMPFRFDRQCRLPCAGPQRGQM